MEFYYKVPKKINYIIDRVYDEETEELISKTVTNEISSIQPDIPEGTTWIGIIVGEFYFIKTNIILEEINGIQRITDDLPDALLQSKIKK